MNRVVLGIGTSHSPLLTFGADLWLERAQDDLLKKNLTPADGRTLTYEQLNREVNGRYASKANREQLQEQASAAQRSLDRLAAEIAAASPDFVVIIGDDQGELFGLPNMPALSIFYGKDVVMTPRGENPNLPDWLHTAYEGYGMDAVHRYEGTPEIAFKLIEGLIDAGVDVGAASEVVDPRRDGFGHAFGFVVERLFGGRRIPIIPILLNTYYPPNVIRPARCHDIGRLLRRTIEGLPGKARFAIIASGGLSHFVTDETLDRRVIDGLRTGNAEALRTIPMDALRSGSSEILNWILAGGALETLPNKWAEYLPVYRTPAGTGIGLGFTAWVA